MGDTTDFEGRFDLSSKMNHLNIFDTLQEWNDGEGKKSPIDGYCQWVLTKDREGIEWDNNEKFYDYVEWLQHIIDDLLLPNGYTLSGEMKFQGEEKEDNGVLKIINNIVIKIDDNHRKIECPHCGESFFSDET